MFDSRSLLLRSDDQYLGGIATSLISTADSGWASAGGGLGQG